MICQSCGVEAPTQHVVFYQNIGALVMRFQKKIEGNLCKSCIHKYFWEFTLITLFLGWWGVISFFATLFFYIPNNIIRYLLSLSLKPVPPGATFAELSRTLPTGQEQVVDKEQIVAFQKGNCIGCRFADLYAIQNGKPWCTCPEPPNCDLQHCYSRELLVEEQRGISWKM